MTPPIRRRSKTSLGTLDARARAVDWPTISKGKPEAWLYFYEDFLEVYDNALRKRTGSYYTPPEVVGAMVRLVDEALRSPAHSTAPPAWHRRRCTLADPAVGTGTFLLGVLPQHRRDRRSRPGRRRRGRGHRGGGGPADRVRDAVRPVRRGAAPANRRTARADSARRADPRCSAVRHRHAGQPLRRG